MSRNAQFPIKINKILGKHLYESRIRKGYSRQTLANAVEVTHQQIQKYEKGTNHITIGRLYLAVKFLGEDFLKFLSSVFSEVNTTHEQSVTLDTNYQRLTMDIARDLHSIKNEEQLKAIYGVIKIFKKK